MAGRRPKPAAIKRITGNPGHRAIKEIKGRPGIPKAPKHLSPRAAKIWKNMAPMLHKIGLLRLEDEMVLERLCETCAEVQELSADILKNGRTQICVTEAGAEFERPRPQVAMLQDADRRYRGYLTEFGLTPATTGKVNANTEDKEKDAISEFLGG